jgi:hypothetical protein
MAITDVKRRLSELVLYIAQKSETDPGFGKTKLLKLLAYADFISYARTGESMTGATYVKQDYGPVPREYPGTEGLLRATRRLKVERVDVIDHPQSRIVALKEADTTPFRADRLAIVDEVIREFWGRDGRHMRDQSHEDFKGWWTVEKKQEIPYYTVHMSRLTPSADDLAWAQQALHELELA